MRFSSYILIFALALTLSFGGSAQAQVEDMPFRPFYWVIGTVPDAGEIKADGRTVVFYKNDETYNTNNAQAVISGNKFIMNAFYIYPLEIAVGEIYKVAIVQGTDGWGMNPVDVTISDKGYVEVLGKDGAPLALASGAGLAKKPEGGGGEEQKPGVIEAAPNLKLWFGNRAYQPVLVARGDKFVVAPDTTVKIEVAIDSPFTLAKDIESYSIHVDPGTATSQKLALTASNVKGKTYAAATSAEENKISSMSISYSFSDNPMSAGSHVFSVNANSSGALGTAAKGTAIATVEVMGGPLRLVGTPLTFPSPFRIAKDKTVYIQYTLSQNANIDMYIVGVGGMRIKKFICNAGGEGGSAGVNKVSWNGAPDMGGLAGNAIYVGSIISRDDGKMLGKFKLTIVD